MCVAGCVCVCVCVCVYIYKMYLISVEGYKNVHPLIVRKTGEIWASMRNVQEGMGVKNMPDLILKEIYSIYGTKYLAKEEIKKIQNDEKENFEKYDNLSEDELNLKSNKNVYVKNNVMTTVIKRCRCEKKEAREK